MNQTYTETVDIAFKNILNTEYTDELRNWRNQDFVRSNMTNHDIIEKEEHIRYIESLRHSKDNKVFLALNHQEPLAIITIKIHWDENYIEPGTYIINEKYLGKGYGIIMSYFRLEYIFELMPEGKMKTTILDKNERNISLQKKMGCVFEKNIIVADINGKQEAASVYSLTKEEWDKHKGDIEERIERSFGLKNIKRININD